MAYLLDSNVFITAKDRYYGFDFCPAFWDWMQERHQAGVVLSIESVGGELVSGNDDLAEWAAQRGANFFRPQTQAGMVALDAVTRWVSERGYPESAIAMFVQTADGYLVAEALAGGHTVVTLENRTQSRQKIKIPDVCAGVGVECIDTFSMLRRERARFVLGSSP